MTWIHNGLGCHTPCTTSTTVTENGKIVTKSPPIALQEWKMRVVWTSSDLNASTPASAPILRELSSSRGTSGATKTSQSNGGHLSPGEQAGIGVGVSIACILVFVGMHLVFRRSKRRRKAQIGEFPGDRNAHELSGGSIHEKIGQSIPVEADLNSRKAELDGGWEGNEMR